MIIMWKMKITMDDIISRPFTIWIHGQDSFQRRPQRVKLQRYAVGTTNQSLSAESADGWNKWLMLMAGYTSEKLKNRGSSSWIVKKCQKKTCLGGSSSVLQVSDSVRKKSVLKRCESTDMTQTCHSAAIQYAWHLILCAISHSSTRRKNKYEGIDHHPEWPISYQLVVSTSMNLSSQWTSRLGFLYWIVILKKTYE